MTGGRLYGFAASVSCILNEEAGAPGSGLDQAEAAVGTVLSTSLRREPLANMIRDWHGIELGDSAMERQAARRSIDL